MKIVLIGANGKIGELVQKALAGAGHEIVKAGTQIGRFPSRDREPRKCQEALSCRRLVWMPWPLQQVKSHCSAFGTHR